jgi:hypothetical protein
MIFLFNIALLTIFSFLVYQKNKTTSLKNYFFIGLITKLLAGLAVGVIYQYYYKAGDVLYLFHQGELLRAFLLDDIALFLKFPDPTVAAADYYFGEFKDLNSRVIFFSKAIAIVNVLTSNNFWLTSLWFSWFSFLGFWHCAGVLARLFPQSKQAVIFSFFIVPSVAFWSSGLLKESVLCGALCACVGVFLNFIFPNEVIKSQKINVLKQNLTQLFIFVVCIFLIWKIKYYYLAVLLPTLLAYLFIYFINKKIKISFVKQVVLFLFIFLIICLLASFSHSNFYLDYFLIALADSHYHLASTTDADNLLYFNDFQPNLWSFLKNMPSAVLESLFAPLVWEAGGNVLKLIAGIENLLIYSIFLFTFRYEWKANKYSLLLIACLLYICLLGTLLSLSTPSIGTLVRYKAGFLPFWIYLLTFRLQLHFDFVPKPRPHNQKSIE